jgi:hypothetical protein
MGNAAGVVYTYLVFGWKRTSVVVLRYHAYVAEFAANAVNTRRLVCDTVSRQGDYD